MNNELLLLSKSDIPFIEAQINIHQPTINDIAFIGEESFFSGCQILLLTKEKIPIEDRIGLEDKTDFDIFMSVIGGEQQNRYKNDVMMVFTLLFPEYKIKISNSEIIFFNDNNVSRLNNINFNAFKDIVQAMFMIEEAEDGDYNPSDARAAKIAEKLKKAKQKKNEDSDKKQKVAVFSRYVSILAIGLHKDMNDLMEYTVFQLKDEMKRFQMKQSFDMYMQAKMAGAKDLDEVDNWMDDIHP